MHFCTILRINWQTVLSSVAEAKTWKKYKHFRKKKFVSLYLKEMGHFWWIYYSIFAIIYKVNEIKTKQLSIRFTIQKKKWYLAIDITLSFFLLMLIKSLVKCSTSQRKINIFCAFWTQICVLFYLIKQIFHKLNWIWSAQHSKVCIILTTVQNLHFHAKKKR